MIYDSISWARVRKIIPFYNEMELERLVVDVSKHRFVKVGCLHCLFFLCISHFVAQDVPQKIFLCDTEAYYFITAIAC